MTSSTPLRIGFLGAAWIAEINGYAILESQSNCQVAAIASRSQEKANELALKLVEAGADPGSIHCMGGPDAYQQLIDDKDNLLDAIYIPLPSTLHKKWVPKALEAGKHVLLEKPVAVKAEDFREMMQVAFRCGKLLLDGTMFVHTKRTDKLLQHCNDPENVGSIRRIEGAFSFDGKEADADFFTTNIRCQKDADPMGCVGDLGWYCVYMAVLVFNTTCSAKPVACKAVDFTCTDEGVPIDATCLVYFERGRILSFYCSFQSILRQQITLVGSHRWIFLDDFVLPTASPLLFRSTGMVENGKFRTFERKEDLILSSEEHVQQVLMWKEFSRLVCGLQPDGTRWGGDTASKADAYVQTSLSTQLVMDALSQSIQRGGVRVEIKAV